MKKVFAVFLLVLLGGCSWLGDDYTRWNDWGDGKIVAIMNDSLAIMVKSKFKENCSDYCSIEGCDEECKIVGGHTRLSLINYRQQIEPLLEDTINWLPDIQGQLSDSVVYGFNNSMKEIVFWKMGEKPIRKKINKRIGDCSSPYMWSVENRVHLWKNGQFLLLPKERDFRDGQKCQYAILDTASGVIEQGKFKGNDAWLAECEDISLFDEKNVCLKRPDDGSCGMDILLNSEVIDSIRLDNCYFSNLEIRKPFFIFYGTYIIDNTISMSDCENKLDFNKIHKISKYYKFQFDYPNTWIVGFMYPIFYDGLCNVIRY